MFTITEIWVVSILETILLIAYLVFWIYGTRGDNLSQHCRIEEYPLKVLYPFGFGLLRIVSYKYSGTYDIRLKKNIRIIYGEEYSEFRRRIYIAQNLSVSVAVIILFTFISLLFRHRLILFFGFLAASGVYIYFERTITEVISRRKESVERDLPEVLSKLSLLISAGMIISEAWEKTAESGSGILYKEMIRAAHKIDNGTSQFDAYLSVTEECNVTEVNRFVSALVQNLSKGSKEIGEFLKQASVESWSERKHRVKSRGEEASVKMLIPIVLMFLGIFIMIIVPVMSNYSFD